MKHIAESSIHIYFWFLFSLYPSAPVAKPQVKYPHHWVNPFSLQKCPATGANHLTKVLQSFTVPRNLSVIMIERPENECTTPTALDCYQCIVEPSFSECIKKSCRTSSNSYRIWTLVCSSFFVFEIIQDKKEIKTLHNMLCVNNDVRCTREVKIVHC